MKDGHRRCWSCNGMMTSPFFKCSMILPLLHRLRLLRQTVMLIMLPITINPVAITIKVMVAITTTLTTQTQRHFLPLSPQSSAPFPVSAARPVGGLSSTQTFRDITSPSPSPSPSSQVSINTNTNNMNDGDQFNQIMGNTVIDYIHYTHKCNLQDILRSVCGQLKDAVHAFRSRRTNFRGGISVKGDYLAPPVLPFESRFTKITTPTSPVVVAAPLLVLSTGEGTNPTATLLYFCNCCCNCCRCYGLLETS